MKLLLRLMLVVVVVAIGAVAYLWFAGGSGEPTTELTVPPLASETTEPAAGSATTDSNDGEADTTAAGSALTFVIAPEESEVRFELDEELRGSPQHVVGTTSEVAGQVRFDPGDLSGTEISEILVNARTFTTDSSNRDRAIRGPVVLNSASDEFELIRFMPTALEGHPASAEVGDTIDLTLTGDLTIKGTTVPVGFDVKVTWVDEGRLELVGEALVDRTDFGIDIPNAPGVANVSEEVLLALDFTAVAP